MDVDEPATGQVRGTLLVKDQKALGDHIARGLTLGLQQILHSTKGHLNHANHVEIEATIGKSRFVSGRSTARMLPVLTQVSCTHDDATREQQRIIPPSWRRCTKQKSEFRAMSEQVMHAANTSLMVALAEDMNTAADSNASRGFQVVACTAWGIDGEVAITQYMPAKDEMGSLRPAAGKTKTRISSWKHHPQQVIARDACSFDEHTKYQLGLDAHYDHDIFVWSEVGVTMRQWTFRPSTHVPQIAGLGLNSDTIAASVGSHALTRMTEQNVKEEIARMNAAYSPAANKDGEAALLPKLESSATKYLLARASSHMADDLCFAVQKTKVVESVTLYSSLSDVFDMSIAVNTEVSVAAVSLVGHRLHPTSIISLDCLKMFKPPAKSALKKQASAVVSSSATSSEMDVTSALPLQQQQPPPLSKADQEDQDLKHDDNYIPTITIDATKTAAHPSISVKCRKSVLVTIDAHRDRANTSSPTWRIDLTCAWRDSETSLRDLSTVAFAYKHHLDRMHTSPNAPLAKFEFDQIIDNPTLSTAALGASSGVEKYIPSYEIEFELLNPAKYVADLANGSAREAADLIIRDLWILQNGLRQCIFSQGQVGPSDVLGNVMRLDGPAKQIPTSIPFIFSTETGLVET